MVAGLTAKQQRAHLDRARQSYAFIQQVQARGKMVWSYVYAGTGTPGFTATEPLSNARMFFLWAALEGIQGILYSEGATSYNGNPFASVPLNGALVLLYPGATSPVPSARLEQIRDGIEDWAIYNIARRRHGAAAIGGILGKAGLFSADARGVELACSIGCELKGPTPFSWPLYSHDSSTPRRIEAAKLEALQLASR